MKKTSNAKRLTLQRVTISKLGKVSGAMRGSYLEGCSTSCNSCQEDDACGADTVWFCNSIHVCETDLCTMTCYCGISF